MCYALGLRTRLERPKKQLRHQQHQQSCRARIARTRQETDEVMSSISAVFCAVGSENIVTLKDPGYVVQIRAASRKSVFGAIDNLFTLDDHAPCA